MDLQEKLTAFFIVQSSWISGLILGISIGGVAMALERAITLIASSAFARRLRVRIARFLRARLLMRAGRTLMSRQRRPAVPRFRFRTRIGNA